MLVNDMDEMRTGIKILGFSSPQTEEELSDFPQSNHAERLAPRGSYGPDPGLPGRLFHSLPRFPALAKLDDFKEEIPAKFSKYELPPRISPEKDEIWSLPDFFEQIEPQKVTWQFDVTNKVLHFGPYYRTIFKRIADILYSYHKNDLFSGDVIGRMRIDSNGHITHPYQPVNNGKFDLKGREVDIIHFRWLVAKAVRKYFGKDYDSHLSKYFKLCFSELFLHRTGLKHYYMFQYYHPVFYNDEDKYKLVHVLSDLRRRDVSYFRLHFGLDVLNAYDYHSWWFLLANEDKESMLGGVYSYENNNIYFYHNNPNSLPSFLRNCHEHFTSGTEKKNKRIEDRNKDIRKENKKIKKDNEKVLKRMRNSGKCANLELQPLLIPEKQETPLDPMPYHSELEPKITERFPGIYACMVDSCIRGFDENGKRRFGCTLAQLLFEKSPFGCQESVLLMEFNAIAATRGGSRCRYFAD